MRRRLLIGLLLLLLLLLLCGCAAREPAEPAVPTPVQAADLTLERELLGPDGEKLAVYTAALPQLVETEGTAADQINRFFREELQVLEQDCADWFNVVSGKNYPETRTNSFTYRIMPAPAGLLSVERCMVTDDGESHYFTDLFSLVSGWRLSFSDLYNGTVACESLIRQRVRDWCRDQEIPCDELDGLSFEILTAEVLPDGDYLRFYYDHRVLSVQQTAGVVVEIPRADLEKFLLN